MMETPIKMDDLGVPLFLETPESTQLNWPVLFVILDDQENFILPIK